MIRYYFYAFLGWMAGTFALAKGQTTSVCLSSSSSGGQHFSPADDWQLPTFVAQGNNPAMPHSQGTKKRAHVASTTLPVTPVQLSQPAPPSRPAPVVTFFTNRSTGPAIVVDHSAVKAPSGLGHVVTHAVVSTFNSMKHETASAATGFGGRLARLTAYWAGEGDYYTGRLVSSTGVRLHSGLCAVDPNIIPYGSVVVIPGMGQFLAVDTGSAVIARVAAREAGRTLAERRALVIDLFFDCSRDGERFAAEAPKYACISWWTPSSNSHEAQEARSVFADEDWNKITSKQL